MSGRNIWRNENMFCILKADTVGQFNVAEKY